MITTLTTDNGLVLAYCEWSLVDKEGKIDDNGDFVWIADYYIAPDYRGNGCLKRLAVKIRLRIPHATYFYFWRKRKYGDRIKTYKIDKLLKPKRS